jgi:nicotinate-nucleotide adenylyltransferase
MRGRRHRRIGLLGGSFNPAHGGHLHIARLALQRLDLDEVWWLVAPQNPLKPSDDMAPFAERFARAEAVAAADRRIRVSDIESRLGTIYTADTLVRLRRRFPRVRFVWLMGGDNLAQLPRWQRWTEIFATMPVAVFDRPTYSRRALAGLAAHRYARARVPHRQIRRLAEMPPPAWVYFHTRLDARSATQIRTERRQAAVAGGPTTEVATLSPRPRRPDRTAELLRRILASLDDSKAENVVTIDLEGKTSIADYMVIAGGRSARQVTAMTDHLAQALRGRFRIAIEGKAQGDWVLIDAGDVIVHLFRPEIRAYYNLEKMWGADFPDAARQ